MNAAISRLWRLHRRGRHQACRPAGSAGGVRALIALAAAMVAASAGSARAEAPRFTAEVDRTHVPVGESFVYEVTLSVGNDRVTDYRAPDFKGLRVLSTPPAPSQSTQMQFGGAGMFVQVSYAWRYEVAAAQKGPINIGPARVRVNGQDFRSNVVTVTAVPAAAGTAAAPPPLSGAPGAPGSPAMPGAGVGGVPPADIAAAANGGSFIRLVVDKQKAFVGEAIAATWYLYMSETADKYDTQVEPHTEGFWSEDVVVPSRRGGLVLTQETVQGRPYQIGTVLKKALFPLQVGRFTITPMEAEISRSDFFGNAVRSQRVRSAPTVIEVMPLPKQGQPGGFDAANVGTFTIAARVDRAQVAVGEAVTLTLEIGGRGNLRKLALPAIPKLEGWKAYEPRLNVVVDPASGVTGTKIAEVLLLPERPGAVTLPALALHAFDPDARRYTTIQTAPITLTATGEAAGVIAGTAGSPGASGAAPASSGPFTENVIAEEIRPLHARSSLRRELGTTFFRTRGFAATLAVPPMGFAFALIVFRVRERMAGDSGARRRRQARKRSRARLAAADDHRRRGQTGAFFIEIDRVIREALTARLGVPVKGLRMEELRTLLALRGLPAAEVEKVIDLLEECDRARFAPPRGQGAGDGDGNAPADIETALGSAQDRASALIDVIERASLSTAEGT